MNDHKLVQHNVVGKRGCLDVREGVNGLGAVKKTVNYSGRHGLKAAQAVARKWVKDNHPGSTEHP